MTTSYYLRGEACEHCGHRAVDRHICNNLVDFEAVFHNGVNVPAISTWAQWRTELRRECAAGAVIVDEYGRTHDVEQFIAEVEATDRVRRRRQFDWCASHGLRVAIVERGSTWLDPDGFCFYGGEFA